MYLAKNTHNRHWDEGQERNFLRGQGKSVERGVSHRGMGGARVAKIVSISKGKIYEYLSWREKFI